MTWVKTSDTFAEEFEELGAEALALHMAALGYCARLLTDGRIPARKARLLFPVEDPDAVIKALMVAGRWMETETGYAIVDYLGDQPSADAVRRQQAQKAERQARWLAAKRDASRDASQDASGDGNPAPPRPAPKGSGKGRGGPGDSAGAPSPSRPPSGKTSAVDFGSPDLSLYMKDGAP